MEDTKPKNTKKIAIIGAIAAAVVILVVVLVLVFTGGKKSAAGGIVGKWVYSGGAEYTYNFAENGAGSYGYCGSNYTAEECENYASHFTYTVNAGKKKDDSTNADRAVDGTIDFLYEGNTSPMTLEYHLDGDKLTVYDSFDQPVEYNRSK